MAIGLSSRGFILVLGGTGKVGKRIANQLASAAVPTLVASPSGKAPPNDWLTGVKFDWFDQSTWQNPWKAAGEHGIRAIYLIAPPILDSAPAMIQFVDSAMAKGTRRFVLQSCTPIEAGDEWGMGQLHAYVRRLGNEGRADWAVLRPTWFMENFSEVPSHVNFIRNEKKIYSATDRGILPFVSADDVAACAVVLLTQFTPPHTEYILLGPENMSYEKAAHIIGETIGKRVKHDNLTPPHFEERMRSMGVPEDYAEVLSGYEYRISLNKEHRWNETIRELLGREPTNFRTFAQNAKAVWI